VTSPFIIASVTANFGVAAGLGASAHFLAAARRVGLPLGSLDARPTIGLLREFALKLDARGRLNARAGYCVAFAALCQAGSIGTFLLFRSGF
jgi:hypothetical protein